jgi:hypothetical protein
VIAVEVGIFVVDEVADFGLAAILEVLSTANALREQISPVPSPWTVATLGVGHEVTSDVVDWPAARPKVMPAC